MRTVFLGSSRFAVAVLGALAASPHSPALVVTPPDRPQGRGRRTAPPPAAVAARDLGLALLQAESVNDSAALDAIAAAAPEAVGVCEFGQLIREPLLPAGGAHGLVRKPHPQTVRVRRFARRILRPGSVVQVWVTRPGEIGKYTRLRIRSGKRPVRVDRCLMPGSRRPARCPV